jgi:death-on-curing protein
LKDGGRPGLLNEHAVRSAIARPYHGHHRRIHEKAAALLHSIVCNHGFVDGNKRTALYLVELFVEQSGYEFVESDVATVEVILSVARGDIEYQELVAWFGERILRG